ncbi:MAG: hypothetical protein FWC43_11670 [Planctomycetaceae bacterium]|nr:hypothetical protein [Planctomycetaceae bacterium]
MRKTILVLFAILALTCTATPAQHYHKVTPEDSLPFDELVKQFENPGNEWRGKPFWSWNGKLEKEELLRQIDIIHKMGFGGFFMHSRTGLITEYLGDEWFELTNACADYAETLGLEAWLYDEDRWPSGTAGGMVTANPEFSLHFMRCTIVKPSDFDWNNPVKLQGVREPKLVAVFAADADGLNFTSAVRITPQTPRDSYANRTLFVFNTERQGDSSFYNGHTYVDTMNLDATKYYIQLTHEQYKERLGDRFGRTVKGIFTDEPHRGSLMSEFSTGVPEPHWVIPWTAKLPEAFQKRFGYDIIENLPELFLKKNGQKVSPVKWAYMELTQSLFLENFMKPLYDWCSANNAILTGHVLHEDSLATQAIMQGSLMRSYEYMHYPGVDQLTEGNRNYWIVKQLQSAGRQLGQKFLLDELYGCTGWQMTFENYKAVGDWQALFGINVRCPHLSWYTMLGESKRDYPASIFYQSAWWEDWEKLETYYARLGVLLSQGQPIPNVLVINPVESLWCQFYPGWCTHLSAVDPDIVKLEEAYRNIFHWLAGNQIDFDYGDEDMIARLGSVDERVPFMVVGNMNYYSQVVVPPMTTIRGTTMDLLEKFAKNQGSIVFLGDIPKYVDSKPSDRPAKLAEKSKHVPMNKESLISKCQQSQYVTVVDSKTQKPNPNVFVQARQVGSGKDAVAYIVAMNMNLQEAQDNLEMDLMFHSAEEWDPLTGKRYTVNTEERRDAEGIIISFSLPPAGEKVFVLKFNPDEAKPSTLPKRKAFTAESSVKIEGPFDYQLSEPNVCVLDYAEATARKTDGSEKAIARTEILKIDQQARDFFGLPHRGGEMLQPWYQEKIGMSAKFVGSVQVKYDVQIDTMPQGKVELALEEPDTCKIWINGKEFQRAGDGAQCSPRTGWWIDPAFVTFELPVSMLKQGENQITIEKPYDSASNLEAMYLLGDFGVEALPGGKAKIVTLPKQLTVGDICTQGLPFYGGKIVYEVPLPQEIPVGKEAILQLPEFFAALVNVWSDGCQHRMIGWQPFETCITDDVAKNKSLSLELVLNRRNTFGPLHQIPKRSAAYGPPNWITGGADWSDDYQFYPSGLLQAPVIEIGNEK